MTFPFTPEECPHEKRFAAFGGVMAVVVCKQCGTRWIADVMHGDGACHSRRLRGGRAETVIQTQPHRRHRSVIRW